MNPSSSIIARRLPAHSSVSPAGSHATAIGKTGIPQSLEPFLKAGRFAGAAVLVAQEGAIQEFDAIGMADLKSGCAMQTDALFWVASMTKPITAAAVMMLVEQEKLALLDPVENYLPEFKGQQVIQEKSADTLVLKCPSRPITLLDLLTHTSGVSETPQPHPEASLAEWVREIGRDPLLFEPGTRWQYGNNGMNTLGCIVEAVSGEAFADFLQQRLLAPLGMGDTTFHPSEEQLKRLAVSHAPTEDGQRLEETGISMITGPLQSPRRTVLPGSGLFSTMADMFRFYQMILNGGIIDGRRYLAADTVKEMTRIQTGNLETGFTDGMGFGLGFGVVKAPAGVTSMLPAGTCGHDGVFGTSCWVVPEKKLLMMLMMQRAKLYQTCERFTMRSVFHTAVMEWLASRAQR